MSRSRAVQIVEVGARDGLQNERQILSVGQRLTLLRKLSGSGLKRIEGGAFVSPKWVPQMASSDKVFRGILRDQNLGKLSRQVRFSSLVPNLKGLEGALKSQVKEIAVFGASSETFSRKNINCSIAESLRRFSSVVEVATENNIKVRGYLSTAFGCPYEGEVSVAKVVDLVRRLLHLDLFEVSVGDTIGVATPKQVEALLNRFTQKNIPLEKIAMHFHDTRGTALANVVKSLECGVRVFDSSVGGLGGCPYASGAAGNLATEDLVYLLSGMGYSTGVDLKVLIQTRNWLEKVLDRHLPARVKSWPKQKPWKHLF